MKILYLGPKRLNFIEAFNKYNDEIIFLEEKIKLEELKELGVELIISYGYRHIISEDVIHHFKDKIINLHTSYLPWNRGAHPNFWSIIENTPKGVTIHLIDEGIDTGKIIFQQKMNFSKGDTLKTSYEKLSMCIEHLFVDKWEYIRRGDFIALEQDLTKGSIHYAKDIGQYSALLSLGWDTPIKDLINKEESKI